jgi:hypothetical protein
MADYITVAERLGDFHEQYETGRVITEIVHHDREGGFIIMKASIFRHCDDAEPAATGHAFEDRSQGQVNAKNYIENCESSAVGRALANLGFETKRNRGNLQAVPIGNGPKRILTIENVKETPNGYIVTSSAGQRRAWKDSAGIWNCAGKECDNSGDSRCGDVEAVIAYLEGKEKGA